MKAVVTLFLMFLFAYNPVSAQTLEDLRDDSHMIMNNKDREKVIKQASKFIKKNDTISEVFEIRARAYEWIDKEKSVEDYRRAIDLDSTNVNAHNGLGNVLSELKRYDEALVHYELALKHGAYIGILLNIANLYEEIKDYENWERVATQMASPEMDGFNRQLGLVSLARMHKSKGENERAVQYYMEACEIGDADGYYLVETAKLLIELNRNNEACKYLERAKKAHDYEYDCCPDVPELMEKYCEK